MLRLSKLTDYAIVLMTWLAQHPGEWYSAVSISQKVQIELPTVSKILKMLTKQHLICSLRGAQGGYRLSGDAHAISVANIIEAMEGPIGMTECSVHKGNCSQESICAVKRNWKSISDAVANALNNVSLAEMAKPLDPEPLQLKIVTNFNQGL